MWNDELQTAKEAALKAGMAIMDIYEGSGDIGIEYKADDSPLTRADKASNDIIVNGSWCRKRPQHPLMQKRNRLRGFLFCEHAA